MKYCQYFLNQHLKKDLANVNALKNVFLIYKKYGTILFISQNKCIQGTKLAHKQHMNSPNLGYQQYMTCLVNTWFVCQLKHAY